MQTTKWIFQISRPRFWFYVLGPVLLAVAATANYELSLFGKGSDINDWVSLVVTLLFFSLPANLLIYGINDLFDYETDKHNEKKKSYEALLEPKNRARFLKIFSAIIIPSIFVMLWVILFEYNKTIQGNYFLDYDPNIYGLWSLVGFLFFGIFYSTPPIRAKTKPFLDAFFNILYVFPGILAYALIANKLPPNAIIIAATLWVMAMHAFSAVPDIDADKKAGINTIATVLGRNVTIILCASMYILSAVYTYEYLGYISVIAGAVYLVLMIAAYYSKTKSDLFKIYKLFPYINVVVGFVLFWSIYLINS
jgi:4-hydroxybenzoate polyprenyltransferase